MSTSRTDSSARGFTPISSSAYRATPWIASVSTSAPDSLAISMDKGGSSGVSLAAAAAVRGTVTGLQRARTGVLTGLVPALVRVDDVADQPVPHHIMAGQPREVDILH